MIQIRPIELIDANEYVARLHRHHDKVVGHRFSLSAYGDGRLCGVAICGRPVAKSYDPLEVLEVIRLCTDGTAHACSCLYAAAARAGRAIGYLRVQTYILASEPGTSLIAAGWTCEGPSGGGVWNHSRDKAFLWGSAGRDVDFPTCEKTRWSKALNVPLREMAPA